MFLLHSVHPALLHSRTGFNQHLTWSLPDLSALNRGVIRIFDVESKQVTAVLGSQGYFSPPWSPDGKYLAAISIDNMKFVVYDFQTQKWSDCVTEFAAVGTPIWSRDTKYLYFDVSVGEHVGYYRVQLGDTHPELIADLKDLHRSWWSGITPDNVPIFSHDISTDEIYALELELP